MWLSKLVSCFSKLQEGPLDPRRGQHAHELYPEAWPWKLEDPASNCRYLLARLSLNLIPLMHCLHFTKKFIVEWYVYFCCRPQQEEEQTILQLHSGLGNKYSITYHCIYIYTCPCFSCIYPTGEEAHPD
uniref:Uncharacterized protein n=1 Tax=Arundo donax TaxID=35708 RepID=A0A0A8YP18_ARUDO